MLLYYDFCRIVVCFGQFAQKSRHLIQFFEIEKKKEKNKSVVVCHFISCNVNLDFAIIFTFGVSQLYNAIKQYLACVLNSTLFWSLAIWTIRSMALSAGACFGKSSLRQYVVAKLVKNFNSAILVLTVGVWAASIRILKSNNVCYFFFVYKLYLLIVDKTKNET